MVALIVFVVVLLPVAAFTAEFPVKSRRKARLRRDAEARLSAATAVAEANERERRERQEDSAALRSLMPAIHACGPRHVCPRRRRDEDRRDLGDPRSPALEVLPAPGGRAPAY